MAGCYGDPKPQDRRIETFVGILDFQPQTMSSRALLAMDFILRSENPRGEVVLRSSKAVSYKQLETFKDKKIEVKCIPHGSEKINYSGDMPYPVSPNSRPGESRPAYEYRPAYCEVFEVKTI